MYRKYNLKYFVKILGLLFSYLFQNFDEKNLNISKTILLVKKKCFNHEVVFNQNLVCR